MDRGWVEVEVWEAVSMAGGVPLRAGVDPSGAEGRRETGDESTLKSRKIFHSGRKGKIEGPIPRG